MVRAAHLVSSASLLCALLAVAAVKVKVSVRSGEMDSKLDDEERAEPWERRKHEPARKPGRRDRDRDDGGTPERPHPLHPNELIFPLIYKQAHVSSAFKFAERWYTWSTERRTDGSNTTNYYVCSDEPKRCDEIGWERTELPRCAFQVESLLSEDRACLSPFGEEPRGGGDCVVAQQMKVSEIVRLCGARIRSLWRFVRVGRRTGGAAKPADVNALVCEDEDECVVNIEYRIHHDRITFSLHEPTRGQTFKSGLKRDVAVEGEAKPATERSRRRRKRPRDLEPQARNKSRRPRLKPEGRGLVKERNDSGYYRRNKIKIYRDDVSGDTSE